MTTDAAPFRVLNLGWGVQSFTLAAMVALGELPPVDVAIHADTTHEMQATYTFASQWTPWLAARGVPVVTVRNETKRGVLLVLMDEKHARVAIPAFAFQDGLAGPSKRQCTSTWKIEPIVGYVKRHRNGRPVEQWLGISKDEWHRAKDSGVSFITHRYPLLEKGFTRGDCLTWLADHGGPSPGKSSCTFCPYHNRAAWEAMKRAGGQDWQNAVAADTTIRNARAPIELYLHRSGKPLDEAVVIPEDFGYTQLNLLEVDDADAECDSGHCFL